MGDVFFFLSGEVTTLIGNISFLSRTIPTYYLSSSYLKADVLGSTLKSTTGRCNSQKGKGPCFGVGEPKSHGYMLQFGS